MRLLGGPIDMMMIRLGLAGQELETGLCSKVEKREKALTVHSTLLPILQKNRKEAILPRG